MRRLHGTREVLGALGERAEHVPGASMIVTTCSRGTSSTWPGKSGRVSRNATKSSSSSTTVRGNLARDDPAEDAVVRHQATTSYSGARPRIPVAAMTSTARRQ